MDLERLAQEIAELAAPQNGHGYYVLTRSRSARERVEARALEILEQVRDSVLEDAP